MKTVRHLLFILLLFAFLHEFCEAKRFGGGRSIGRSSSRGRSSSSGWSIFGKSSTKTKSVSKPVSKPKPKVQPKPKSISRQPPPKYTPGNNPYSHQGPSSHYGYPPVNRGQGYGYSRPMMYQNNFYSGYHRTSMTSTLLNAYMFYSLARMMSHGSHYGSHYNVEHHYYHKRNESTESKQEQASYTVDLNKQPLYEMVPVSLEDVMKNQVELHAYWLNESLTYLPFYGMNYLMWSDSYLIGGSVEVEEKEKPPEELGFFGTIGSWFSSAATWWKQAFSVPGDYPEDYFETSESEEDDDDDPNMNFKK